MPAALITINELLITMKEAFFSLNTNKCFGYHEISSDIIENCFSELNDPLKYLSIEKGVFPDAFKIARVTPLFKDGNPNYISN